MATAVATGNVWAIGGGSLGGAFGALLGVIAAVLRGVEADRATTLVLAALGIVVLGLGSMFLLGIVAYFAGLAFGAVQGAIKAWSTLALPARAASFGQTLHDHRRGAVGDGGRTGPTEAVEGLSNKV
jgi:hypothetical protein